MKSYWDTLPMTDMGLSHKYSLNSPVNIKFISTTP